MLALSLTLASAAAPACAQAGASISLDSDYLLHGVSLSDGRPVLSVTGSYDHPSGTYASASVSAVSTRHSGIEGLGYVANLGYARQLRNGLALDVGVQHSRVALHLEERHNLDYAEVYAGLSGRNLSAHVYYSPDTLGEEAQTLYVDLGAVVRPADGWRLTGHLGALRSLGDDASEDDDDEIFLDVRAGVVREFSHSELRLTWSAISSEPYFPEVGDQDRTTLQGGFSYFF